MLALFHLTVSTMLFSYDLPAANGVVLFDERE